MRNLQRTGLSGKKKNLDVCGSINYRGGQCPNLREYAKQASDCTENEEYNLICVENVRFNVCKTINDETPKYIDPSITGVPYCMMNGL